MRDRSPMAMPLLELESTNAALPGPLSPLPPMAIELEPSACTCEPRAVAAAPVPMAE